ncbi:MAG: trehalose-phosphatase [Acidobacteria bacterium]|nr:trehalose-phosphatase [Acidobacteriota bacterium]
MFSDFDGTLTPIRRLPDAVHLAPAIRELLEKITQTGATLGIVSGRKVTDLQTRVGLPGIWYVGAHGYEVGRPDSRTEIFFSAVQEARMKEVRRQLARRVRGLPGILLEFKQATLAVHHRQASSRNRALAWTAIQRILQQKPELSLLSGKKVWELLPDSHTSKWTAIQHILSSDRRQRDGRRLVFYLGDDSTDEKVFEKMNGFSVFVGRPHSTKALFFLRSPAEVRLFLRKLSEGLG